MSDRELTARAKPLKFESNISIQINPVNSGHDVDDFFKMSWWDKVM